MVKNFFKMKKYKKQKLCDVRNKKVRKLSNSFPGVRLSKNYYLSTPERKRHNSYSLPSKILVVTDSDKDKKKQWMRRAIKECSENIILFDYDKQFADVIKEKEYNGYTIHYINICNSRTNIMMNLLDVVGELTEYDKQLVVININTSKNNPFYNVTFTISEILSMLRSRHNERHMQLFLDNFEQLDDIDELTSAIVGMSFYQLGICLFCSQSSLMPEENVDIIGIMDEIVNIGNNNEAIADWWMHLHNSLGLADLEAQSNKCEIVVRGKENYILDDIF